MLTFCYSRLKPEASHFGFWHIRFLCTYRKIPFLSVSGFLNFYQSFFLLGLLIFNRFYHFQHILSLHRSTNLPRNLLSLHHVTASSSCDSFLVLISWFLQLLLQLCCLDMKVFYHLLKLVV